MQDEQEHQSDFDRQFAGRLRAEYEVVRDASSRRKASATVASEIRAHLESKPGLAATSPEAASMGGRERWRWPALASGLALAAITAVAGYLVNSSWKAEPVSPSLAVSPPGGPVALGTSPAVASPLLNPRIAAESPAVAKQVAQLDGMDGERGLQVVEAGFSGIFSALDKSKSMLKPLAEAVAAGSDRRAQPTADPKATDELETERNRMETDERLIVGLAANFLGRGQVFD